jgi:hypothetical protein
MATQVMKYYSRWDLNDHVGRINLYDADNNLINGFLITNPDEFQVIVGMLRYERPLWFSAPSMQLRTGYGPNGEPVGEEET